jgi:hypothetical protein
MVLADLAYVVMVVLTLRIGVRDRRQFGPRLLRRYSREEVDQP